MPGPHVSPGACCVPWPPVPAALHDSSPRSRCGHSALRAAQDAVPSAEMNVPPGPGLVHRPRPDGLAPSHRSARTDFQGACARLPDSTHGDIFQSKPGSDSWATNKNGALNRQRILPYLHRKGTTSSQGPAGTRPGPSPGKRQDGARKRLRWELGLERRAVPGMQDGRLEAATRTRRPSLLCFPSRHGGSEENMTHDTLVPTLL